MNVAKFECCLVASDSLAVMTGGHDGSRPRVLLRCEGPDRKKTVALDPEQIPVLIAALEQAARVVRGLYK